jgi:acetyl-CoA carboxylase biotin carboxyl carrier protein
MIDIRKLKELIRLMVTNDLTELDLRDTEEQVTLRRPGSQSVPVVAAPVAAAPVAMAAPAAAAAPVAVDDTAGLVAIESPMVGTFFAAPGPGKPDFVSAGDSVSGETVVCVLEAMKIFNEIKAETTGTIAKVLVANGESVEFGQPIFMVRPN